MKQEVERELGLTITEEQFQQSEKRAKEKQSSIISRFGDACGIRRNPEYLAELICEDVKADILSKATVYMTENMLYMGKEHSANCQSALQGIHIVAKFFK